MKEFVDDWKLLNLININSIYVYDWIRWNRNEFYIIIFYMFFFVYSCKCWCDVVNFDMLLDEVCIL